MAQIFKAKTLVSSTGRFSHEATAPNLVYNTGDQTISGNKTFNNDVVFTGTAIFNEIDLSDTDSILLSGIDIQIVSGSMTLTNSPTISGNPFITGNLALYATTINLATTGSTLDTKINNLSGYINSTGSNIVFTTGNQNIGGNKTFTGVTTFSGQQVNLIDTALNLSGVGDMTFEGTNINFINSPVFISGTNLRVVGDVIANNLVYKTGNQTVSGNKTFIGVTTLSGANNGGFIGEGITLAGGNGAGFGGNINLIGGIGSAINDGLVNVNASIAINRGTNKNSFTDFYKSGDAGVPYLSISKDEIQIKNGATLLVSGVAVTPAIYVNTTTNQTIFGVKTFIGNHIISGDTTITGHLSATSKSFLIDHPTQIGKKLQYGSLEGPEHGVFVRGKTNDNIINLPNYWPSLVDENSISVNLTPINAANNIYVVDYNNTRITTNGNNGNYYFYTVYGERKDIPKLTVEF